MFHLLYKLYKNKAFHLFILSALIFIFLNIVENYIHYNIGRNRDTDHIVLSTPSKKDWIKIIYIMLIFAFLQGGCTYYLSRYT